MEQLHYAGSWEEKFWEKVSRGGSGRHWVWEGTLNPSKGYGTFRTADGKERDVRLISWGLCKGEIPAGQIVERTCSNALCLNPDHLTLRPYEIKNRTYLYKKDSRTKDVYVRFWEKVEKRGVGECWLWKGGTLNSGFGLFQMPNDSPIKTSTAHRIAYQFAVGEIPKGKVVSQSCEEKLCVNPRHLVLRAHNGERPRKARTIDPYLKFWNQVERYGERDCWNWKGKATFSWKGEDGKQHFMIPAKCALFFSGVEVTKETRIFSTCGTARCCNPKHIRLGDIPIEEQIQASIVKQDNGCWIWQGETTTLGQPRWHASGQVALLTQLYRSVHSNVSSVRFNHDVWIIPECGTLLCVNPTHLLLLPYSEARQRLTPLRFWSFVEKTDGCWLWKGGKDDAGYGRFCINRGNTGAHRYSYALTKGPIPHNRIVCHTCNNPPCVNPNHLYAGTPKSNGEDMAKHKRNATSPGTNLLLLTDQIIIRRRMRKIIRSLAREFSTSIKSIKSTVRAMC